MREVLLLIFLCTRLTAQINYPDKQFTTHDGLPQIQITDMIQDQRGYIWIGTKKGLARFNGETFNKIDHPILDIHHIQMILEDSKGHLLFFLPHPNSIVYKYDGSTFSELALGVELNYRRVALLDDHLYILVGNNQLLIYNIDTLELVETRELKTNLRAIFVTANNGLKALSHDQTKIVDLNTDEIRNAQLDHVFQLNIQHKGNPIIRELIETNLVNKVKTLSPDLKEYTLEFDEYIQRSYFKSEIKPISAEDILIQSLDTILRISQSGMENKYKVSNTTRVLMLEDNDSNLWVSHENGLEFFANDLITSYPKELISDIWAINSINEKFYYCSYSKGIFELDENLSKKKSLYPPVPDRYNYSCSIDAQENIYFSGNRSLVRFDGNKFDHFPLSNGNLSLINHYDELNDQLIIGGNKCIGILKGDSLQHMQSPSDTCLNRFVVSITNKSDEEYWVGTYTDVASYNHVEGTYTSHTQMMPHDSTGAIALCVDKKKNLWIGNRHGLWHKKNESSKATNIVKEAFAGEFVLALKELPNNILAIGTSNGFSILDLKEYRKSGNAIIKNFNHRNGFRGEEVAQNGFLLKDSTLFIPSSTYLSSVQISDLNFSAGRSDVFITSINEQKIPWAEAEQEFVINKNDIAINFEGLGFNEPFESRYSYILVGVDEEWSPWTSSNKIEYSDLTSGDYVFRVKKQTSIYKYDEELPSDSITFEIDIPIYKEPDFYKYAFIGLLLLSGLLIGSFFHMFRNIYVRRQQEDKIKYLEIQALQSQLNPHFIFNVLGTIQSLVLNNQTEQANKYLVSFSKLIRRFLDSNVSNNPKTGQHISDNQIALREEIELLKLYIEFELLQYADKFSFKIITTNIDTVNLNIPPMIIQPFVENAIKHGLLHSEKKGILTLEFQESEDALICTIDDDGIGRKRAGEIQKKSPSMYKSQGVRLVQERIALINKPIEKITIETVDKQLPQQGTRVIICFDKEYLL